MSLKYNIIIFLPQQDPRTKLRTELLNRPSPSRGQPLRKLLTPEEMDDRNPSQFLRHLRSIAPDVPDYFCTQSGPADYL
jgi:hypothetical protein